MGVPNLSMFLFHTILTLDMDINSSFCNFLINYPNISVLRFQKITFLTLVDQNIDPTFLLNHSNKLVDVCKILNSDV